jgi:hypothetical protein
VKTNLPLLAFCLTVLSIAGVLIASSWRPLPWYHWLLAALALPAFVLILSAVALTYVTVTSRQPRIVLSSPVPIRTISLDTTATDILQVFGQPTDQWDDDTENCLEYSSNTITIRFMCSSTRTSSGRFQYLELVNEKPGNA